MPAAMSPRGVVLHLLVAASVVVLGDVDEEDVRGGRARTSKKRPRGGRSRMGLSDGQPEVTTDGEADRQRQRLTDRQRLTASILSI